MPIIQRKGIDHDPVCPWQWGTIVGRSEPVEILSYPIPNDEHEDTIMVRLTVGDCRTLTEIPFKDVAVFSPDRWPV